jgi:hypothetical protein
MMIDLVRRQHRWLTAMLVTIVATLWWLGAEGGQGALTFSMAAAFGLGPQVMNPALWPRAVWYLPISKRDAWRATWLLATVGAALMTTSAKLLGMLAAILIPQPSASLGLAALGLSGLYDFAYAGCGCALVAIGTRPRPAREPWRLMWDVLKGPAQALFPLGVMIPLLVRAWGGAEVPVTWGEMTPRSATLLAAALGLSIAAYFHTLEPGAGFILVRVQPRQHRAIAPRPPIETRGPTGLPRLLLNEYAWSAVAAVSFVIAFAVLVFGVGALIRTPWSLRGLVEIAGLLFDEAVAEERGRVFDVLTWTGLFAATLVSRVPQSVRHLRALPLAGSRLNLLLVAWPALMLITVWVGMAGLRYAVFGPTETALQPAMLLALIGSSAIARAMKLRWPVAALWAGAFWLCAVPALRQVVAPSSAELALIGLAGIVAAAALNHYTLRRSATYRRAQPSALSLAGPW